jgi:hypothetical protein
MGSGEAFLPYQLFLRGVRTENLYFGDSRLIRSQAGVAVWLTRLLTSHANPINLVDSIGSGKLQYIPLGFRECYSSLAYVNRE